jgi:GNAT superfamily N-acetyltransferase
VIDLRTATAADAPAVSALIRALSAGFTLAPDGAGADSFFASVSEAALRDCFADPQFDYRVATAAGQLAGVVAVRGDSHLYHLFVAPAHAGRGLARLLWHTVRDAAIARAHPAAFTVNATVNALPVYARFGFVPTGPVQREHGIAFVPMRLALPVKTAEGA